MKKVIYNALTLICVIKFYLVRILVNWGHLHVGLAEFSAVKPDMYDKKSTKYHKNLVSIVLFHQSPLYHLQIAHTMKLPFRYFVSFHPSLSQIKMD